MANANPTAAHVLKPIHGLIPLRRWDGCHGISYAFEDTEEAIRKSGFVPEWMPYPSKGVRSCISRYEPRFVKLSRLKEGRLRLWISADLVISSDQVFRNFLGALLVDTRLSLVKPLSDVWDEAVGEYNSRSMVNQYVLRGGSCLIPQERIRASFRNFLPAKTCFQVTGIQLARDTWFY